MTYSTAIVAKIGAILTNLLNAGMTEAEILEATCFYEWTHGGNGNNGGKIFRMKLDDKLIRDIDWTVPFHSLSFNI